MYKILEDNINNLDKSDNFSNDKYLIQTSQPKNSGTKLPEVLGVE